MILICWLGWEPLVLGILILATTFSTANTYWWLFFITMASVLKHLNSSLSCELAKSNWGKMYSTCFEYLLKTKRYRTCLWVGKKYPKKYIFHFLVNCGWPKYHENSRKDSNIMKSNLLRYKACIYLFSKPSNTAQSYEPYSTSSVLTAWGKRRG